MLIKITNKKGKTVATINEAKIKEDMILLENPKIEEINKKINKIGVLSLINDNLIFKYMYEAGTLILGNNYDVKFIDEKGCESDG